MKRNFNGNNIILGLILLLAVILSFLSLFTAIRAHNSISDMRSIQEAEFSEQLSQAMAEAEATIQEQQATIEGLEARLAEQDQNICRDVNVRSIAHRGVSAYAPENTLPAFRLAKELGFSCVETDIQFTSDGVPA